MKKIIYLISGLAVTFLLTFNFSGCVDQDFGDIEPRVDTTLLKANTTIAELKSIYTGSLTRLTNTTFFNRDSILIEGIVISDDTEGNFYKTLVIEQEDGSAAIEVKIEKTNLFLEYKRGQRVVIYCNGLYLGDYGGLTQLGSYYTENNVQQMGGITGEKNINDRIFKKGDTMVNIAPKVINRSSLVGENMSKLVEVQNVQFDSLYYPGTTIVLPYADKATGESLDHPLQGCIDNYTSTDSYGNVKSLLVVRTSGYSKFANKQIPVLKGTIRGILSFYNGTFQIIIRDLEDVDLTQSRCL